MNIITTRNYKIIRGAQDDKMVEEIIFLYPSRRISLIPGHFFLKVGENSWLYKHMNYPGMAIQVEAQV
jgi:hypothetical protein